MEKKMSYTVYLVKLSRTRDPSFHNAFAPTEAYKIGITQYADPLRRLIRPEFRDSPCHVWSDIKVLKTITVPSETVACQIEEWIMNVIQGSEKWFHNWYELTKFSGIRETRRWNQQEVNVIYELMDAAMEQFQAPKHKPVDYQIKIPEGISDNMVFAPAFEYPGIAVSHEMPTSILKHKHLAGKINDYMFVLLHRYLEDEEYRNVCNSYSGTMILDNSCFELGAALSDELIANTVEELRPTFFVLPDVLMNNKATLQKIETFINKYPELIPQAMAVIQGETMEEMLSSYRSVSAIPNLGMIGIPFHFKWMVGRSPQDQANERVNLLDKLEESGTINLSIRHHLLGTWHVSEFYNLEYRPYIVSIDTSNPIAAALEGIKYNEIGTPKYVKPGIKFDDYADMPLEDITPLQFRLMFYNAARLNKIFIGENT
jgi:hypothetical protein